jgi:hypothetical protein
MATVKGTRSGSVRGGGTSITGAAKSAIMRSSERFWAPSDLPGAESTVQHLLADLTRQGELRRVRRGLYWRGTKTPLGMSPPPTTALVARLAPAKGSGPAGLSAANALRLNTQIPRRAQVAVPARAKRSTGAVEFVSRPTRTGRCDAALSPTEVALLEVLGDLSTSELDARETWERLVDVIGSDSVRAPHLAKAAKTEPGSVRARLSKLLRDGGYLAEAECVPDADPRVRDRALAMLA